MLSPTLPSLTFSIYLPSLPSLFSLPFHPIFLHPFLMPSFFLTSFLHSRLYLLFPSPSNLPSFSTVFSPSLSIYISLLSAFFSHFPLYSTFIHLLLSLPFHFQSYLSSLFLSSPSRFLSCISFFSNYSFPLYSAFPLSLFSFSLFIYPHPYFLSPFSLSRTSIPAFSFSLSVFHSPLSVSPFSTASPFLCFLFLILHPTISSFTTSFLMLFLAAVFYFYAISHRFFLSFCFLSSWYLTQLFLYFFFLSF